MQSDTLDLDTGEPQRQKGVPAQSLRSLVQITLQVTAGFLWSLCGPPPQAVLPTEGPSTRRCTPKPKEWTEVAVCRGCVWCLNWGILTSAHEVPWGERQLRDSGDERREQMGGWCGNLRTLNILNGNLAFWAITKLHLSKKDDSVFFFWPCHVACGISAPQSGIEPCLLQWEHGIFPPGKSQKIFSLTVCFQKLFHF